MKIGAKVPNSGALSMERGLVAMARELEDVGFGSLWVSDHIVMPTTINSTYPFAPDGRATWATDTPYLDAMISLGVIAAVTSEVTLGTAVLVLPLRNPVILAKQAASIDVVSSGRLSMGIGVGWLSEEFDALDVPFDERGRRFVEWIAILRECWRGTPDAFEGRHYRLPSDVLSFPQPTHEIPLLVGGHSPVALKRAGTIGSGWLAQQSAGEIDESVLTENVLAVRTAAHGIGRDPSSLWFTLRLVDSVRHLDAVEAKLPALREAGIDEVIVDVDWSTDGDAEKVSRRLRDAAAR